ncbi:hypothetical protein VTJ04DRAFT_9053 [Mycothermus thermophilus]|uniref:uncharacterized protein n=1 Tax=Humicola insolens TaxID=85995 RepID=UPI003742F7EB
MEKRDGPAPLLLQLFSKSRASGSAQGDRAVVEQAGGERAQTLSSRLWVRAYAAAVCDQSIIPTRGVKLVSACASLPVSSCLCGGFIRPIFVLFLPLSCFTLHEGRVRLLFGFLIRHLKHRPAAVASTSRRSRAVRPVCRGCSPFHDQPCASSHRHSRHGTVNTELRRQNKTRSDLAGPTTPAPVADSSSP